jgi:hypothetical protein
VFVSAESDPAQRFDLTVHKVRRGKGGTEHLIRRRGRQKPQPASVHFRNAPHRLLATVLSPEFERDLIRERTTAGRRNAGETLADIARSYGVHLPMILRL